MLRQYAGGGIRMSQIEGLNMRMVPREAEINAVGGVVKQMLKGQGHRETVLGFHGVRQIGKTTFLRQLKEYLSNLRIPIPCALIEFPCKEGEYRGRLGQIQLLADMASALPMQAAAPPDVLIEDEKEFDTYISMVSRDRPVVLLFDSLDRADRCLFDWLETSLFSRIAVTGRFLIVTTSWHPLEFRLFELCPPRARVIPLGPFDESMVRKHLPLQYEDLASRIRQLTNGHPLCDMYVVQSIQELRIGVDEFDSRQSELAKRLWEQCVGPVLMAETSDTVKTTIQALSPLRRLDLTILRAVLSGVLPSQFAEATLANLLQLIAEMVESKWVRWDHRQKSHCIDDTLRAILEHYMLVSDRQRFIAVHEIGLRTYGNLVRKVPEMRWMYIIQRLYHLAQLLFSQKELGMGEAEVQLKEELRGYLELYYSQPITTDVDGLDRLIQELVHDPFLDRQFPDLARMVQKSKKELVKQSS